MSRMIHLLVALVVLAGCTAGCATRPATVASQPEPLGPEAVYAGP